MASGELAAKLSKRRSLQGEDESAALSSLQGSQDFAKTWDVAQELGAGSGKVRASARKCETSFKLPTLETPAREAKKRLIEVYPGLKKSLKPRPIT